MRDDPSPAPQQPPHPRVGAIAVLYHRARFLLVQRRRDPLASLWEFPGGHIEWGETAQAAAIRELREETGVQARAQGYLTNLDVIERDPAGQIGHHYFLAVVTCAYLSGEAVAGDDAQAVAWVSYAELCAARYPLIDGVCAVAELALEQHSG